MKVYQPGRESANAFASRCDVDEIVALARNAKRADLEKVGMLVKPVEYDYMKMGHVAGKWRTRLHEVAGFTDAAVADDVDSGENTVLVSAAIKKALVVLESVSTIVREQLDEMIELVDLDGNVDGERMLDQLHLVRDVRSSIRALKGVAKNDS